MNIKLTFRIMSLVACLLIGIGAQARDSVFTCNSYLTLDAEQLRSLPIGEELMVDVFLHRMDDYEGITSGDVFIDLPSGLEITYAEWHPDVVALDARGNLFCPFSDPLTNTLDNQYRFIWFDATMTPFTKRECGFIRLLFKKTDRLIPGSSLCFSRFEYMIAVDNNDNVKCVNAPFGINLGVTYVPYGDVNGDCVVDIFDINAVINHMLGRGNVIQTYADVNSDGSVDVFDVNIVINEVLHSSLPATFTVNGVTFIMLPVQGGTFTMGATAEQGSDVFDSEKPPHQVTLNSYSIGQTEVTQELWLGLWRAIQVTTLTTFNVPWSM